MHKLSVSKDMKKSNNDNTVIAERRGGIIFLKNAFLALVFRKLSAIMSVPKPFHCWNGLASKPYVKLPPHTAPQLVIRIILLVYIKSSYCRDSEGTW